jgi:hypothetical protein
MLLEPQDLAFAREQALDLARRHPHLFEETPVRATLIAAAIGIRVEKREEASTPARLETSNPEDFRAATIVVRRNVLRDFGRLAVAHEIGHAVLLARHPSGGRWHLPRREAFATAFAHELLVAGPNRCRLESGFRGLRTPLDLLRFAAHIGLPPFVLLSAASASYQWMNGSDTVWIQVMNVANSRTRRDRRPRVVRAFYDYSRLFVVTNQSFSNFGGSDDWLQLVPLGGYRELHAHVGIKRRVEGKPRWRPWASAASLSATRLRAVAPSPDAQWLVVARPDTPTPTKEDAMNSLGQSFP